MGDLDTWMDESFVKSLFQNSTGDTVNVKIIRDRNSGYVHVFSSPFPYPAATVQHLLPLAVSTILPDRHGRVSAQVSEAAFVRWYPTHLCIPLHRSFVPSFGVGGPPLTKLIPNASFPPSLLVPDPQPSFARRGSVLISCVLASCDTGHSLP